MIRVIVSDLDGTLLGTDHRVAGETLAAVAAATRGGIRFMIATSRNYPGLPEELKNSGLIRDYILNGGAQIREGDGKIVERFPLCREVCREVYRAVKGRDVSFLISSDDRDDTVLTENALEEILEKENVYKIYLWSREPSGLHTIREVLRHNHGITVTSSYINNLEITDRKAKKGPVLENYLVRLGYKMEEVMVIGDSMNDYSMLSMDFGITVAMGNAVPEVKRIAKYITKTNDEFGVAYAVRTVMERQNKEIRAAERRGEK